MIFRIVSYQVSVLSPLLFIIVLEAFSRELRKGLPMVDKMRLDESRFQ